MIFHREGDGVANRAGSLCHPSPIHFLCVYFIMLSNHSRYVIIVWFFIFPYMEETVKLVMMMIVQSSSSS